MTVMIGDQAHYKRDYVTMVDQLVKDYPLDRAMELAVGGGAPGDYELSGRIQEATMLMFGLRDVQSYIDIGCGSGRLAHRISRWYTGKFLGLDIVPAMLAYANSKTPANFRFEEVSAIKIPTLDNSADLISAFSLFTHLLDEEIYLYLEEVKRVLRPGGKIVFSFLEFGGADHSAIFKESVEAYRMGVLPQLNAFFDRDAVRAWARMLGLEVDRFVSGPDQIIPIDEPVTFGNGVVMKDRVAFGQSVAVLRKPG